MRTGDLAKWIGFNESTVRLWTVEYGQYLSPSAQEGQRRRFTDHDQRVLALVAALKDDGRTGDEIHAALKSLQADGWKDLPPMPAAPPDMGPIGMIPTSTADERAQKISSRYQLQVIYLEETVERLESELTREKHQRADLQAQLTTARESLGEMRGRLAAVEVERQAAGVWLRWLAAAVVLAVLLTAALAVILAGVR